MRTASNLPRTTDKVIRRGRFTPRFSFTVQKGSLYSHNFIGRTLTYKRKDRNYHFSIKIGTITFFWSLSFARELIPGKCFPSSSLVKI